MILDDDARRVRIEDEDTAPVPAVAYPPRRAAGSTRPPGPRDSHPPAGRDGRDDRNGGERGDPRIGRPARTPSNPADSRARGASRSSSADELAREPDRSRPRGGRDGRGGRSVPEGEDGSYDDARARYRAFRAQGLAPGQTRWSPSEPDDDPPPPRDRPRGPSRPARPDDYDAPREPRRTRAFQDERDGSSGDPTRAPRDRYGAAPRDPEAPPRMGSSARDSGAPPRRDRDDPRAPHRSNDDWRDSRDHRSGAELDDPNAWSEPRDRRARRARADDEWDAPRHWTDRFRSRRARAADEWDELDRVASGRYPARRDELSARDDRDEHDERMGDGDTPGSGHRLSTTRRRGRGKKAPLSPSMRAQRRKRRLITWAVVGCLILVAIPVVNSPVGAWGADALRATLGPRLTAQVESYYFGATDALTRLKAHFFGTPKNAPWAAAKGTPLPTGPQGTPVPGRKGLPLIMSLPPINPVISPALAGEGQWVSDGLPGPSLQIWPIPMAKSFVRPDPDRPYAVVMLVAIDLRQTKVHLVDGTTDPAAGGPGVIPAADQSATSLLAAFNGGFKASDGGFGLMTDGHTYLPAVNNAATLAVYADGTVRMGAWGTPAVPTANLVAYRQNGDMLIENGQINQSVYTDGYAWGAPILANIYTWRSALAMTSSGVLVYAAGNSVTAETMAKALAAAGATQAMELDINPVWVRFNTYSVQNGTLVATKLRDDMYGWTNQYLIPYSRDFIYLTRVLPPDWPTSDPHVTRQGG